ncbi:MAG: DUF3048 domain-containing protein [Patescibacteria group bacterium]
MHIPTNEHDELDLNNVKITPPTSNESEVNKAKRNAFIIPVAVLAGLVIVLGVIYFFNSKKEGGFFNPTAINDLIDGGDSKEDLFENPLTGELVPMKNAEPWKDIRPMGVMVNNAVPARPQSGLIYADVIYEIVAEGGITRFLPFFLSNTPEKIGPVRSTREYYLVLVKEMGDAMLMHIGWSPQALEAIETWPVRSLGRGGGQFWRDQNRLDSGVATEHTAYVDGTELRDLGNDLGWQGTDEEFRPYLFKDEADIPQETEMCYVGECNPITIDFWYEGDYSAIWEYDRTSNSYLRFMGYDSEENPIPHKDQETGEQIKVKNFIVQFASETQVVGDEKGRLEYELIGSGTGIVFIDGTANTVTWSKAGRDDRTLFYYENGEEVEFNRGKFWISIVPDRNVDQVNY